MEIVRMSKVLKVGNSLAIVLPLDVRQALEIERGDYMVFAVYAPNILTARKLNSEELQQMKPQEIQA